MSSVQHLRVLISERLTVAAQEIFTEFEKITVRYEEEIDRQRKLLETSETLQMWMPQIKLHKIAFPQRQDSKVTETLADQGLWNQEDPGPLQIKEDLEKLCTIQHGKLPAVKQEADTIAVSSVDEQNGHSASDFIREQLLPPSCPPAERQAELGSQHADCGSIKDSELKTRTKHDRLQSHSVEHTPIHSESGASENATQCEVCGITLKNRSQIYNHYKIHTGVRPHTCTICHKGFMFKCYLTYHMRTHTGERPFSCKTCGKGFTLKGTLSKHLKSHNTAERPNCCEKCGKTFKEKSNLVQHMESHTGKKPYSCEICGKSFRIKNSFNDHLNTHTGDRPYSCKMCGKGFRARSNLIVHQRTHTGYNPYSCNSCGKHFSQRRHLNNHLKTCL